MTSGKNPLTGVWAATEDFFWDKEFRLFLENYQHDSPSLLIINGDLLDFMQVLVFPDETEKKEYGITDTEINFTYGLRSSEAASVFQIDKVVEGHHEFYRALAEFISRGNYVKILKGNHDIQIFWNKVQERIIYNIQQFAVDDKKDLIKNNIEFPAWFYYLPGKIYVEHGNQYEYTTSFRNFLYPSLPYDYEGVSNQVELDLSSFLVRYFSNRMEAVNPLSDNIRPLSKYLGEFWRNYPYIFITSIGTAFRYVLKAFNKAKAISKMKNKSTEIDEKNKELIKEEACRVYPDDDEKREWFLKNLFKIDGMKAEPILSSGAFRFLWNMLKPPLKGLLWVLPFYLLMILPDLTLPLQQKVNAMGDSFWKSILNLIFTLKIPSILIIFILAVLLISIRTWIRKKKSKKNIPEAEEVHIAIRENARKIAEYLNVKYVVFGHTHYADIHKLSESAFYFNTGTWMGIFSEQEELYRNVKQFTFFLYENDDARLLYWNVERNCAEPVIVVDTETPLTQDEDSIIKILLSFFKR